MSPASSAPPLNQIRFQFCIVLPAKDTINIKSARFLSSPISLSHSRVRAAVIGTGSIEPRSRDGEHEQRHDTLPSSIAASLYKPQKLLFKQIEHAQRDADTNLCCVQGSLLGNVHRNWGCESAASEDEVENSCITTVRRQWIDVRKRRPQGSRSICRKRQMSSRYGRAHGTQRTKRPRSGVKSSSTKQTDRWCLWWHVAIKEKKHPLQQ